MSKCYHRLGKKKSGENTTTEAQDLNVFFVCLFFDVGTCEALTIIPLVRKNLACSLQINRKGVGLNSNLIKPIL